MNSRFENYGPELPFSDEVMLTAGQRVPGAFFIDIRCQALRLSPERLLDRIRKHYEPKFSAGIWFFGGTSSRFHLPYKREMSIEERLEIASELPNYGLMAIEAHYPWEINAENLHLYGELEKQYGVKVSVVAGIGGDFRQEDAQFGTISSPLWKVREKYLEATIAGLTLA